MKSQSRPQPEQQISADSGKDLPDPTFDIALGLRALGQDGWLTTEAINKMDVSEATDGIVLLRWSDENGCSHAWTFDRTQHFGLIKYVFSSVPDGSRIELSVPSFTRSENIAVPEKIVERFLLQDKGKEVESRRIEIGVKSVTLNDPHNTVDSYIVMWPLRAQILDSRSKQTFVIKNKPRTITDADIFEQAKKREDLLKAQEDAKKKAGNAL